MALRTVTDGFHTFSIMPAAKPERTIVIIQRAGGAPDDLDTFEVSHGTLAQLAAAFLAEAGGSR